MARILTVDDDSMILHMLNKFLTKAGHEVVGADSGDACLEKMGSEKFDLLLLDMEMVGKSGEETLLELREKDLLGDTPVVFASGNGEDEVRSAAERLGIQGSLTKPFKPKVLQEYIADILG